MPKATLDPSKAVQGGFGIQEGNVEVTDARFKIIQRTMGAAKGGGKVTPMFTLQLDVTKLDDKWERIDDSAIEQKEMIVCWGSKEADESGLHSFKFRPGLGKSAADADPNDQGAEIDTEGNTIYAENEGDAPFADSECSIFMKSLEKKGWKSEINAQSWAPNYIGTKMAVKTVDLDEYCKQLGIRHSSREGAKPTCWEVTNLHTRPYEGKGKPGPKPKATTAATTTKAAPVNGAEATNGRVNAESLKSADCDPAQAAIFVLSNPTKFFTDAKVEKEGTSQMKRAEFQKELGKELMRHKVHVKVQRAINDLAKDDEALTGWGVEAGFMVDVEQGTVAFA